MTYAIPTLPTALDFDPIREQATRNGSPVEGRFWVINPLNDSIIGDGKTVHNPQNYRKMWDSLWMGLSESTLDLTGVEIKARSIDNGAAMRAEIVLPNHDFSGRLGEASKMKIVIGDSHDQTVKRSVSAMILRLACTNGMIAVREKIGFAQKHTTFSDPQVIGAIASGWLPQLESEVDLMKEMTVIKIDQDTAIKFYRENVAKYRTSTGWKYNEKMLERIIQIHNNYDMGNNAYRVYNTLTHLSTHVEVMKAGADVGRKQLRMEQDIETVLRGSFQELITQ
jgi:hypothetical protein